MDLNNKNGQPSMEEILASIRRIIAEEPTAANPVIDLHAKYRQKADDHEDGNDFELPSIFRPAAPAPERQPLFGRLTDAIRSASNGNTGSDQKAPRKCDADASESQERYRGALRESGTILALANGQGGLDSANGSHQNGEPERYRGALRDSGAGSLSSALSSLKLTRGAESSPLGSRPEHDQQPHHVAAVPAPAPAPVAAAAPVPQPSIAPASASSGVEDVRRVMVPFRDMRMSRMATDAPASSTSASAEASALDALLFSTPHQQSEPAPVHHAFAPDFPAPPVQEAFQAHVPPPPQPQAYDESTLSLDDMHRFAAVEPQRAPPPPPPPPAAASEAGAIEDTTADLLRPMLRQWLSENMPRMVEKALSIELAESVKSNRKFNGS